MKLSVWLLQKYRVGGGGGIRKQAVRSAIATKCCTTYVLRRVVFEVRVTFKWVFTLVSIVICHEDRTRCCVYSTHMYSVQQNTRTHTSNTATCSSRVRCWQWCTGSLTTLFWLTSCVSTIATAAGETGSVTRSILADGGCPRTVRT
jgi:hypothetical protein